MENSSVHTHTQTHTESPGRLKPNNPMSYIYWFMLLILPVSNDIIIQWHICACVCLCSYAMRANSLKSFHPSCVCVYLEQMSLKLKAHPDAMEVRGWVSGRNERTVGRSIHVFRAHTFHVVSHVSYMYRWCFGTGSKKIFVWRFHHVCYIVYLSFYVTQFGSHHSPSLCPCQFRCCAINSSESPNIVIFLWIFDYVQAFKR